MAATIREVAQAANVSQATAARALGQYGYVSDDARERVDGYRAAMARHAPGVEPVVLAGDFSEEAGEAAARTILDNAIPCDAVFAANDMMAIGCLQTLQNAGIDVPGTVAVAGFGLT